jgi:hypothetical protein
MLLFEGTPVNREILGRNRPLIPAILHNTLIHLRDLHSFALLMKAAVST